MRMCSSRDFNAAMQRRKLLQASRFMQGTSQLSLGETIKLQLLLPANSFLAVFLIKRTVYSTLYTVHCTVYSTLYSVQMLKVDAVHQ